MEKKPVTKYAIYIIPDNGNGIPERLEDYDGESIRNIRIAAFARDSVISIEPLGDDGGSV
jgi:hypothetical protein